MTQEELDLVVANTKHERYRWLVSDDNPDADSRDSHRRIVVEIAARLAGRPADASPHRHPSPIDRIRNFGVAVAKHAIDGFRNVDETTRQARLAVCGGCPSLKGETCLECGCPVGKKAGWASEACPKGLWTAAEPAQGRCTSCGAS